MQVKPRIEKTEPKPPVLLETNSTAEEPKIRTPSAKPTDMDDVDFQKSATESAATSDERVRNFQHFRQRIQ